MPIRGKKAGEEQDCRVMNILFFILIAVFCVIFLWLMYKYNRLLQETFNEVQKDSVKIEEQLNLLVNKNRMLLERNNQLERSLNEIVTVYEYVKKLGSTMEFSEAVKTLKETLRLLIQFSGGKLIVLQDNNVLKTYEISSDNTIEVDFLKKHEENIISKMIKSPQIFIYEKGRVGGLGTFPADISTLIGLPLIADKQLVAVIILENMHLNNIDKIQFITLQFAMEVKKTQLYEKVRQLSKVDSLTQLYLRRHFMNLLTNEIDRGYRQDQPMSFLMLDIDYFKKYNDEYGHLVGDLILKKIADILKEKSREIDLLCRYGGDEFALALPRTGVQDAFAVAERLRRAIGEYLFQISEDRFQVTISIGISSCNKKDMNKDGIAQILIDLADRALYQAKALGRNKVILNT